MVNHSMAILATVLERASSGWSETPQNQLLAVETPTAHDCLLKDARDDRAADTQTNPEMTRKFAFVISRLNLYTNASARSSWRVIVQLLR